ncbi:MAG: hypothetical protein A2X84_11170 [Desulfuromonadaceae bacterium GWC2_58_13]|nr:MAG: hypothetical protein A2X84_11170 [Desulfuromonadaceae bacterium GWC2_58_13]
MNQQPKTKGELVIEKIMEELDPTSERYQILAVASTFKSSWVALGERLLNVKRNGLFQQWGYENFEDYCSREVRIKKPTAQKLTLAYGFIEKEEPQLMTRHTELKPLPDYRSVELLRQAKDEKDFSAEEYADLRRAVVEENRSHPTILKRFKDVASNKEGAAPSPLEHIKAGLSTARRLAHILPQIDAVPERCLHELESLMAWLQENLENLAAENPAD